MKRMKILALLVGTILWGPFTTAYGGTNYAARELGVPLGEWGTEAYSINSSGMAACISRVQDGSYSHGYLVSSGGNVTNLGIDWAMAVNNNGQVAGAIGQNGSRTPVVRNSDGHIINLQTPDWALDSVAQGINDNGFVVGWTSGYNDGLLQIHPATWNLNTGTYTVLDEGFSSLNTAGVNSFGKASWSGYAFVTNQDGTKSTVEKAFVWDAANGPTELDKLADGDIVYTYGINDASQIVGLDIGLGSDGNGRAVIWDSNGNVTTLAESLNGGYAVAKCINNSGQVAGQIAGLPVLWNLGGGTDYLPMLPEWSEVSITGINDRGQVVGQAFTSNGVRAVIWEPVPEPSACLALVCGLFGILARVKKRQS